MADLRLTAGPLIALQEQEEPFPLTLRNRSATACALDGYPVVELRDDRGRVPFRFVHGGRFVGHAAPSRVEVAPGHAAYVVVAKNRCTGAARPGSRRANRVVVSLAGTSGSATATSDRFGFGYCAADAAGSAAIIVQISPFASSIHALFR